MNIRDLMNKTAGDAFPVKKDELKFDVNKPGSLLSKAKKKTPKPSAKSASAVPAPKPTLKFDVNEKDSFLSKDKKRTPKPNAKSAKCGGSHGLKTYDSSNEVTKKPKKDGKLGLFDSSNKPIKKKASFTVGDLMAKEAGIKDLGAMSPAIAALHLQDLAGSAATKGVSKLKSLIGKKPKNIGNLVDGK